MPSVPLLLDVLALLCTVLAGSGLGRVPLWIAVLLLGLSQLLVLVH